MGTSASVVGGSLTIAGGILTLTTAGAAAPLLIAGIATSSVGAATNIGTSIIEKAINSKQVNNAPGPGAKAQGRGAGRRATSPKPPTFQIPASGEVLKPEWAKCQHRRPPGEE